MVKVVRNIRIFLSSPGDLTSERKLVADVCQKLRQDLGGEAGFSIELLLWETHTFSARGESAQQVINQQIGDDYDVFIGMMAQRFGTPTGKFGSGTEEEFHAALQRNKESSTPEIMFFFHERIVPTSKIDTDQLAKVQAFRKLLSEEGVLYFELSDEISFWSALYSQLWKTIQIVLKKSQVGSQEITSTGDSTPFDPLFEWNFLNQNDSEVNGSVLIQKAAQAIGQVNFEIVLITKANTSMLKTFARESQAFKNPTIPTNFAKIIRSINSVTSEVRNTSERYLEVIPRLHAGLRDSVQFAIRSVTIFVQRNEMTKELSETFRNQIAGFRESLEALGENLSTLDAQLAVEHAPGTGFSVEQRKFAALTKDLRRVIQNGALEMRRLEAAIPCIET